MCPWLRPGLLNMVGLGSSALIALFRWPCIQVSRKLLRDCNPNLGMNIWQNNLLYYILLLSHWLSSTSSIVPQCLQTINMSPCPTYVIHCTLPYSVLSTDPGLSYIQCPNWLLVREGFKKKPLNLWSWSYLAGPPPLFWKLWLLLGFFLRLFWLIWWFRYVLKHILGIFETNFG